MVSNMSPPQSKSVPILAAFFSCCLMVVACSCVFTVLTICLHERKAETHEMSPLVSLFIQCGGFYCRMLPYILMMRTPDHPRAPKPKVIAKSILPIHRLSTLPLLNLPRPSTLNTAIQRKFIQNLRCNPARHKLPSYFDSVFAMNFEPVVQSNRRNGNNFSRYLCSEIYHLRVAICSNGSGSVVPISVLDIHSRFHLWYHHATHHHGTPGPRLRGGETRRSSSIRTQRKWNKL
ncbi:hypothetical protein OSTOST_24416 [Ostertagia ostertagi]